MHKFDLKLHLFIIASLLLLMFSFVSTSFNESRQKMINNFYNDYSARIIIQTQSQSIINGLTQAASNTQKAFILYDVSAFEETGSPFIGVLSYDFYDVPQLEYGRFFEKNDFYLQRKVAVVGHAVSNKIYYKNCTPYVSIEENEFEVVGIMKQYGDYQFNQFIYYNLTAGIDSGRMLQLDATSKSNMEILLKSIPDNPCCSISFSRDIHERLFHYFSKSAIITFLFAIGAIVSMLCCIMYILFITKQAVGLYWFLGIDGFTTDRHIIRLILYSTAIPIFEFVVITFLIKYFAPLEYTACYSAGTAVALLCTIEAVIILVTHCCLKVKNNRGYIL